MEETEKLFEPTPIDRDATLATPRFDAVEAQVARPVVPLTNSSVRSGGAAVGRRRQWPIALVLISALAGGVVSLLAFRLYQQRQQQSQVAATQADNQTPETETATGQPLAQTEQQQASQSESPVVFEEFDPAKEGVATVGVTDDAARARKAAEADAKPPTATTASKDERKEEAKPSAPRAAEPRPRLVETMPAPRQVQARGENVSRDERADDDDDFFEERRERRRQRREQRREGRREPRRNIDRIKDIFEGPPPA